MEDRTSVMRSFGEWNEILDAFCVAHDGVRHARNAALPARNRRVGSNGFGVGSARRRVHRRDRCPAVGGARAGRGDATPRSAGHYIMGISRRPGGELFFGTTPTAILTKWKGAVLFVVT